MIGRLIYKLIKPFFLKYYYLDQSKKKGFENMTKAFIDSNGRPYYVTINDFDTPHVRTLAIEKSIMRLRAGLSEEDNKLIRDTMKKALNSGKKSDLAMIGHCLIEMDKREESIIHPDILFDIAALKYIREDEDPAVIDSTIHNQKIEQFKKDSLGGLKDFFYNAGLNKFIPYLEKSESDWDEFITMSKIRIQGLKNQLQAYTTA